MERVDYKRKLNSYRCIAKFMGSLAPKYSANEFKLLYRRMGIMVGKYGVQFVADAIGKDRADAELALLRYGR